MRSKLGRKGLIIGFLRTLERATPSNTCTIAANYGSRAEKRRPSRHAGLFVDRAESPPSEGTRLALEEPRSVQNRTRRFENGHGRGSAFSTGPLLFPSPCGKVVSGLCPMTRKPGNWTCYARIHPP